MIVTTSPSQSWCVGQASRGMTRWLTASAVWSSVATTGDTASSSEVPAGRSWGVLLIVTCISHIKRKKSLHTFISLVCKTLSVYRGLTSRVSQYESLHGQRVVVLFAYASIIWIRSRVSSQPPCSRTVAPLRVAHKGSEKYQSSQPDSSSSIRRRPLHAESLLLFFCNNAPLANSCLGVFIERGCRLCSSYRADFDIYASSKSCSPFGTKKFQGRNSLVPAEELFSSKGGTFRFLGRKIKFPALEICFSKVGKLSS